MNNFTILCGSSAPPQGVLFNGKDQKTIQLDTTGSEPDVEITTSLISRKLQGVLPPILLDLLELATYVYTADQACTRGGDAMQHRGEDWRRDLTFVIPVREPAVWRDSAIQRKLCNALEFVSEDNYRFQFIEYDNPPPVQQYVSFSDEAQLDVEEILLFSGGLDSLAGALDALVARNQKSLLVSHHATGKIKKRQDQLADDLGEKFNESQFLHCSVKTTKPRDLNREFTQRTRSFLYASIAAVIAERVGLDEIRFFENGIVSLNLPIVQHTLGARATRTTHPKFFRLLEDFFSALFNSEFQIKNPFVWDTKADVIQRIVDAGAGDLIRYSVSCGHTWETTKQHPHCGTCSQCVDRRFGVLAADAENHEPGEMYKVDLLTGPRKEKEHRVLLESYIRRAHTLVDTSQEEFFSKFGETWRVARNMEGDLQDNAKRIVDLHKQHGEEVNEALRKGFERHADKIAAGKLPPNSALAMTARPKAGGAPTTGERATIDDQEQEMPDVSPIRLFFSYAGEDEEYRKEFEKHLTLLERKGALETWHFRKIEPGEDWENEIDENLQDADLVTPLLSPDFLASDYCFEVELEYALEQHAAGEMRVVPVVIRHCAWQQDPNLRHLQALPRNANPVASWEDSDEAWLNVTKRITKVMSSLDGG